MYYEYVRANKSVLAYKDMPTCLDIAVQSRRECDIEIKQD